MLNRLVKNHRQALIAAAFSFVLGLASLWLLSPESRVGASLVRASYDWSQSLLPDVNLSNSPVVIVYLDLDSYFREKQNPLEPWNRELHAELLKRLAAAKPKAVVFDIIFDEASTNSAVDEEFARAIRKSGNVVLAGEINLSSFDNRATAGLKSIEYVRPADMFLDAAAAWGVASMKADRDFVVRAYFRGFSDSAPPSLTAAAAKLARVPLARIRDAEWIRYYGKPFAIPHVSYSAALRANGVSDNFFRDKMVLIGARPMAGTFQDRKDQFRSPLASWGDNELFMPAVEVQATQLLNLQRGDSLKRLSLHTEMSLLGGAAILLSALLFWLRPRPAVGAALLAEGAVFGVATAALAFERTWFPGSS